MARVRKPQPTLEALFFSTPEQKVLRMLLTEPTTSFSPRIIGSKLKGVRGLGGGEGIKKILEDFLSLGLVEFVNNQREVRLHDDNPSIQVIKVFAAICDLESLKDLLIPHSRRGILYGTRAQGRATTDSTYDVLVVSEEAAEVERIASGHPLGKLLAVTVKTPEEFRDLEKTNGALFEQVRAGAVLWGRTW